MPVRFTRSNALELVRSCDLVVDGSDNFRHPLPGQRRLRPGGPALRLRRDPGLRGPGQRLQLEGRPHLPLPFSRAARAGNGPELRRGRRPRAPSRGSSGRPRPARRSRSSPGIGEPLSGRLLVWNALTMTFYVGRACRPRPRAASGSPSCPPRATARPARLTAMPDEIDSDEPRADDRRGRPAPAPRRARGLGARTGSIEPSMHVPSGGWRPARPPISPPSIRPSPRWSTAPSASAACGESRSCASGTGIDRPSACGAACETG